MFEFAGKACMASMRATSGCSCDLDFPSNSFARALQLRQQSLPTVLHHPIGWSHGALHQMWSHGRYNVYSKTTQKRRH